LGVPDPPRKQSANLYDIYHCCVYSEKKKPDDGQRNCPKHVEFHSKNKFEKLVHLVGFIVRGYKSCLISHCAFFFLIPGRKRLGGYAVDSQNKEMLENDREKYSGVYRGVVFFLFPFINL